MKTKDVNRVFLMIVCLYLIGGFAAGVIAPSVLETAAGSVLCAQCLILAGTLTGCRMLRISFREHMQLRLVKGSVFLFAAVCTAAFYPFLILISALMRLFVRSGTQALTDAMTGGNLLWNLLLYAFLPACIEELMNRGLLYRAYRKTLGVKRAILLSAFLFGLFHMNLDQFMYTFVFGIFLCLIAESSGSILPCMVCHGVLNAISVTAAYFSGALSAEGQIAIGRVPASIFSALREMIPILSAASADSGTVLIVCSAVVCLLICAVIIRKSFTALLRASDRQTAFCAVFCDPAFSDSPSDESVFTIELFLSCGLCILYMISYEMIL